MPNIKESITLLDFMRGERQLPHSTLPTVDAYWWNRRYLCYGDIDRPERRSKTFGLVEQKRDFNNYRGSQR